MDSGKRTGKWGPKRPMRPSQDILLEAENVYQNLSVEKNVHPRNISEVRAAFAESSRSYYSLAAASRRSALEEDIRGSMYKLLFKFRALLESRIGDSIMFNVDDSTLIREITKTSFFGRSIKQGVSIRYPLNTCVPTASCGGRCYAHDGRDRDYQRLFRGVLNGLVGAYYEKHTEQQDFVISCLAREIDKAVISAREEASQSAMSGYKRSPRIRFSHVGEMAATPNFTNRLAREIKQRASDVSCVVYTRHPDAKLLDTRYLVINFSVEGQGDRRIDYLPDNARLVSSSWDGKVLSNADVNFLEHHVEKQAKAVGKGIICPVTIQHDLTPTCDMASCQRCFINK